MPQDPPLSDIALRARRYNGSYAGAVAITKNDDTVYDPPIVALYVGGTGDVTFVDTLGNETTFAAIPAVNIIPVSMVKVKSTGTTATSLIALY